MEKYDIYKDIAKRTGGDVYIGVVGPVRTGKSTFITKFMQELVLPNITSKLHKQIAMDEMPQSADGKTIMTTQPKFVPANAVKVQLRSKVNCNVRLIDCVGYLVEGAAGHEEGGVPRLVKTPWSEEEMPFEKAAEIGTQKVIRDHSTIGVLVTTDGTITDLPRANYVSAEERVVRELKEIRKPFIVVLNTRTPEGKETVALKNSLEKKYDVPVLAVNVAELDTKGIAGILEKVLFELPMQSFDIELPKWMQALPADSSVISEILGEVRGKAEEMEKMRDFDRVVGMFEGSEKLCCPEVKEVKLGEGVTKYEIAAQKGLFYEVLSEECGDEIQDDYHLMSYVKSLAVAKRQYNKLKDALAAAEETGYGVVSPSAEDMILEEPELVRQGGRYGVKLRATAPSLHIMKVDVATEVSPIVGTEQQGAEFVDYLAKELENDPQGIWGTNFFGKSLHDLVSEGMAGKASNMPKEAQTKMRKTLSKIVNEGKGGIICILL